MDITAESTRIKRCLIAGSVDVGKSTLLGRMLHDAGLVYRDQIEALQKASALDGAIDFSLLTDGLGAEREQKITIDVAYRYFSKGPNKYILADVPGHEQYTRNMITGASQSDQAIIVIDAERGLDTQSRRHLHILSILRVFPLIIVINKMDAVGYSQEVFEAVKGEISDLFDDDDRAHIHFIPSCALSGDMLVHSHGNLNRLSNTTLFELLESSYARQTHQESAYAHMHIQMVVKKNETRWYLGTVSGELAVGDAVTIYPSGIRTTVADMMHGYEHVSSISDSYAAISFCDYVDAGRGDMLALGATDVLVSSHGIQSILFWLDRTECEAGKNYIMRIGTKTTRCSIEQILSKWDMDAFRDSESASLAMNDIGSVAIKTLDEILSVRYDGLNHVGSFILMDECTNQTVAGGIIV